MSRESSSETVRIGRHAINVTRPKKLLFPDDGITKHDLVDYYARVAPFMLPHVEGRALSMERYPDGIEAPGFFQKRVAAYYPPWIRTAPLEKHHGVVRYVVCDDAATLAYLANQAVITPHAWLSQVDQPENPDQMIFDLDPADGDFRNTCAVAKSLRMSLQGLGLCSFVKTTGSRGLHVMVPLDRQATFDAVRAFALGVASRLARNDPGGLTTYIRKNRRRGRLFIDIGRNAFAQTAVAPYAVRVMPGAPVATPLDWSELDDSKLQAQRFNIRNVLTRLRASGDPWKDWRRRTQRLPPTRP